MTEQKIGWFGDTPPLSEIEVKILREFEERKEEDRQLRGYREIVTDCGERRTGECFGEFSDFELLVINAFFAEGQSKKEGYNGD